jgi:hypothetical protein
MAAMATMAHKTRVSGSGGSAGIPGSISRLLLLSQLHEFATFDCNARLPG